MKKILKKFKLKYVLFILVGLILGGSIGVVATNYLLKAEDVEYKNNQNLQDALDELYGMAETHCPDGKTCLTDEEKTTLQNTYLNSCPEKAICITGPTMQTTNLVSSTGVQQQGLLGIVYLDPTDLTRGCKASNSTSNDGQTTGCMKWYAYKLENRNYSLLLDHDISKRIPYNSSGSNTSPTTIQPVMDALTSTWVVTSRLITADEIAAIVGKTSWNSASASNSNTDWFYFDSKSTTQTATSQGASAYAWLFDRLNNCASYGCNIGDNPTNNNYRYENYWTSSKYSGSSGSMWVVSYTGSLMVDNAKSQRVGIRPVITVPSSILSLVNFG